MVDIDAAIGFVVARGDQVDRARLSWLRSEAAGAPRHDREGGDGPDRLTAAGPRSGAAISRRIDATCFRLAELDDLGALDRRCGPRRGAVAREPPTARTARGRRTSRSPTTAPSWAKPGDPEATPLPDRERRILAHGRRPTRAGAVARGDHPCRSGGAGHAGLPGRATSRRLVAVVPGRRLARRRDAATTLAGSTSPRRSSSGSPTASRT